MFLTKSKKSRIACVETVAAPVWNEAQAVLDAFGKAQAIIEFTPQGEIVHANENFLAALGYRLDEVVGQHHRMFVDPAEARTEAYSDFWRNLAAGRFSAGEFRRVTKSGKEIWISASYSPVKDADGRVAKVVKIASDVTATKLASVNSERLANMVENMPVNVMFADRDLVIRYMNPSAVKTLRKLQHLLPMPVDSIVGGSIDGFHKDPGHQRRILSDPKNLPVRRNISLGDETIELDVTAIIDGTGAFLGSMAAWRVITDQHRTKQQAQSVGQSVAATTTEMAATIDEIAKNVTRTASLAQQAENYAQASTAATDALQESSKAIGKVVGVIQELADQTNLLALNATIEAARAGESGRSFAVVASEVKDLASETSSATGNIEESVREIQARILEVAESIRLIAESVGEVSGATNTIAAAIEEQSITMADLSKTAEGLVRLAEEG
jgi:methyl-accepting chemotaxis protein